ncbi:aryl sulfotransferase [Helicobacter sp. MIT 11-5569]|uniref:hypothetical protein n=1 Tax=Helicobacter sp. MIT 11-5569 TaxID=1548151 RepID=UPI00051F9270|nr:hypothetical protein [Helicobacter sp. MIT 11-5569]TLD82857.1 aryl sulfotransferase [Helicobacter sp. MIT 11-5569]
MQTKLSLFFSFCLGVAASLCCLPALLFLLFGFSFGIGAEFLTPYRPLLILLSLLCFALYFYFGILKCDCKNSCINSSKKLKLISGLFLFVILLVVLFYPEILGWLYG